MSSCERASDGAPPIALVSGEARATVSPYGAELRSWEVGGVPLLWEPDAAVWADVAPILFPVVGWTRDAGIIVGGRRYPLGLHGFARQLDFAVAERGVDHVRLVAASDRTTSALYPFDWTLEVAHRLEGPRLSTRLTVRNIGNVALPYACGLHPGFRWPFAGGASEDYRIIFDEREAARVPVISPDGLFTRQSRAVSLDGRHLPLSAALLAREALCFIDACSQSLRFLHSGSGAAIDVFLEDFPHVALWSRPPGKFLCIEPWTGHGDYVDASGDIADKPSMRRLAPGASATHAATFEYAAGHRIRL